MVHRKTPKLFNFCILAISLFLFPLKQLLAQNHPAPDSLLTQLETAKDDTNKAKLLDKIAAFYLKVENNNKKVVEYAQQELKHSEQLDWVKGQVMAYTMLSCALNASNEPQRALVNGKKGYELAKKKSLSYWQHRILIETGTAYESMNKPEKAIPDFKEAVTYFLVSKDLDDKDVVSDWFPVPAWAWPANCVIYMYCQLKKDSIAFQYAQQILDRCKRENDSIGIRNALLNIALNNQAIKNYSNAIKYDLEALKYFPKGETGTEYLAQLLNLGTDYLKTKDYVNALIYFRASITLRSHPPLRIKVFADMSMRDIYIDLQDYTKTIYFDLEMVRDASKITMNYWDKTRFFTNVIEDYIQLKLYKKAQDYLSKELPLYSGRENIGVKARIISLLSRIYYHTQRYDEALKAVKKSMQMDADYSIKPINYLYLGILIRDAPAEILQKHGFASTDRNRKAVNYLQTAARYKQDMGLIYQQQCYQELSKTYEILKDYKNFHDTYKQYIVIRDSSINWANQNAFIIKLADFQFEKKEDSLKYRQRLTENKLKQQTVVTAQQRKYYMSGIIALLAISFFIARNYYNQRRSNRLLTAANTQIMAASQQIHAEKQRSDNLLLNILPADVAEELKEKGSAGARLYEEVTVLFTDFVNFTTISELLTPQELVDELHTCFKAFDDIIDRHGIEKIKTIGDAYLAVAGLPHADPQHANNTVKAALEIRQFIHDRKERMGNRSFDIRIGIHSGSVVAGIVGVKKFAYDIWGDTVNTAARMEQHSLPGQINLSEKTYELVKDSFAFTYRGEIEAKNKGALKMYFVEKQMASGFVTN